MATATTKKALSWPKLEATRPDASTSQRLLHLRDTCEVVKQFSIQNPQMKASAGYVCDLTSYVLEKVESLVDLPALGGLDPRVSRLVELAEQTKEDVNYVKQITQLLQDRQSLSAAGTPTTSRRETQRWVEDGITLLPGATPTAPTSTTYSPPLSAVHENEMRLRVRVEDQAFRQMLLQTTNVEGRDRVNLAIQTCPDLRPITIKNFTQLQSGDVELGLEKAADKEYLMRNQAFWLRGLGAGAHIIRDTYTIVLHGITVSSINDQHQDWAAISRKLLAENSVHFSTAEVVHMGWLKRSAATKKTKTSITIAFSTPNDANRAIELGMSWAGSHHTAELYDQKCKSLQGHKRQHGGHIGTRFPSPSKCTKCAGPHTAEECLIGPGESGKLCCAICDGSHPSYSKDCPARMKAIEAMELAKKREPAFFPTVPPRTSIEIPSELTPTLPATTPAETRPSDTLSSLRPPAPLGSCVTSSQKKKATNNQTLSTNDPALTSLPAYSPYIEPAYLAFLDSLDHELGISRGQPSSSRPLVLEDTAPAVTSSTRAEIATQTQRKRPALTDITAQIVKERYVTRLLGDEATSNITSHSPRKRKRDTTPCPVDPTQSPPGLFVSTRRRKRFPSSQSLLADPITLTSERRSKRQKTARKPFVDTN